VLCRLRKTFPGTRLLNSTGNEWSNEQISLEDFEKLKNREQLKEKGRSQL
jgi:hypothetical protein